MQKPGVWFSTIAALVSVTAIEAHHSISMFEIAQPIWVQGTVLRYEPVNPHAVIALEETTDEGIVRQWVIEGPTLRRLGRMNVGPDFIQVGDVLEVCGFPPKAEFSSERPSQDTVGYPVRALHGQVLLLPDGQMRHWGPYGKIENCIRPGDRAQKWVDFLITDPMAREAWCASRGFVWADSLPPKAFVAEVNTLIDNPCD
jgi:hypothetical protein